MLPARCASTQPMGSKGSIHSAPVTAQLAIEGSCHYLKMKACSWAIQNKKKDSAITRKVAYASGSDAICIF